MTMMSCSSRLLSSSSMRVRHCFDNSSRGSCARFVRTSGLPAVACSFHSSRVVSVLHHEWITSDHGKTTTEATSDEDSLQLSQEQQLNNNNNQNNKKKQDETIVFLHGIFGSGKNLKTLAKRVVQVANEKEQSSNQTHNEESSSSTSSGILMDLRGHGKSKDLPLPATTQDYSFYTLDKCVDDVHATLVASNNGGSSNEERNTVSSIMGHSYGGRIALEYMHQQSVEQAGDSSSLPTTLWLLDTVPGRAHDSVYHVLRAIEKMDLVEHSDRQSVAKQFLRNDAIEPAIAQWLASTSCLTQNAQKKFQWAFDINLIRTMLPQVEAQDFVGMLYDIVRKGHEHALNNDNDNGSIVHLIKGGLNPAWNDDKSSSSWRMVKQLDELQQYYPHQFQQHTLPKAGHWVHVDDLPGLLEIVKKSSYS